MGVLKKFFLKNFSFLPRHFTPSKWYIVGGVVQTDHSHRAELTVPFHYDNYCGYEYTTTA